MEKSVDSGDKNYESIGGSDRGYVSLDQENNVASGISTQLVPEFSRKLSFAEHSDDINNHGDISDSNHGPHFSQPNHGEKPESYDRRSTVTDMSGVTEEKKQAFLCPCGESFEKSVQLAAHKRWSCRLKEKTAQCDVCNNWFASDMGLKRHMKHAHGGVYNCDNCSLRFPNKIKLTRHWMEAHYSENKDKPKTLKCYECGDTNFDSRFEIECHLVLHKFEKHQQKLASTSHHSGVHFSPYPSPPFMRAMRPPHPHGFGHPWSHFPFRPPPPLFPFMPCSSFAPFRPTFLPPPHRFQFPSRADAYSSGQEDGSSFRSSSQTNRTHEASTKMADEQSSGTRSADMPPHHNHEYIEPTAFPCLFHPPFDYKHHEKHHHQHHEKHHDHHEKHHEHMKKKWKKYLKFMIKGKVPSMFPGLVPPQDLNPSHLVQTEDNQESNIDQEKDTNACEFKLACKFCDKIIEKNKILWHQKKECPVLAAHRCSVCDRVFKKRHFLIRHMHEQNHIFTDEPGTQQASQDNVNSSSLSSLTEKIKSSLQLLNFTDLIESAKNVGQKTTQSVHERAVLSKKCTPSTQFVPVKEVSDRNIDKENKMVSSCLKVTTETCRNEKLRCTTCKHVCQSMENLSEHLKEHISQVLAVQKVREWTSKSSEYFFLDQPEEEDELEGAGSVSTATTSYFDSEITSTVSSALQDLGSNLSSLETTESKDAKWTKPHKKCSRHRHKGEVTICQFCGEKFAFRKDLHYHMESIHKDSTLECPVCKKKFSWKKRGKFYERHLNSHYGVKIFKHKCDACGKTFLENSKLRAHMSLHNTELLHKCTVCGKGYANKSSLVRHERKHTGVKPYQCEICQECFMEKRELLRHSTTHTGLSPFNCEECGQGFTLKTSLMSHMKKKHSKKEKPLHG